ncbi:MAG: SulP family inorganic anion transporter [Saccharothrix sp.]|nr:SulP family inorganic anion transporter [Saccharothrix sp.]
MRDEVGGAGLAGGYRREWLRADLVAGTATAALVLPQAMAYATVAGLPVQVGLYCALVPMAVYALLGTSRPLSVSTTSTISLLTAVAVGKADVPPATAAVTLAALSGVLLVVAGLLRLGFVADFIPQSVIAGFKCGIALVIGASQLPKLLGMAVDGDGFFDRVASAVSRLGQVSPPVLAVSAGTLALLLLLRRVSWLPGPLVAVTAATAVSALFGLEQRGVPVIGSVPTGLPLPGLPSFASVGDLLPAAVGVALITFLESTTAARVFRARTDPPLRADRELVVLGLANVAGGLFQASPASGGMSQTAVNNAAGARSQGSSLTTSACSALVLLVLAPLVAPLPQAALGALVLVTVLGLIDVHTFGRIARTYPSELVVAVAALAGALLLGPLIGVLVSAVLALLVTLYLTNHPPVYRTDASGDGLLVVRIEAQLYFANAHRVIDRVMEVVDGADPPPRVLLLDLAAVPDIDLTSAEILRDLTDDLDRRGVRLWLAGLNVQPRAILHRSGRWEPLVAAHRVHATVADAVERFRHA